MKSKMIKGVILTAMLSGASISAQAKGVDGVGLGVGYGLISGATLEANYPINEYFQVRGSLSQGMQIEDSQTEDNIDYKAKADGSINRLALNYHPFGGHWFLSAGYAISNFEFGVNGQGTGDVTVGNESYSDANISLNGEAGWNSGATLSMGWGHSPTEGWGAMAEMGVIFTGSPDVDLSATGTYDNGTRNLEDDPAFAQALADEESKLQSDLASADFLPILQVQLTYRF